MTTPRLIDLATDLYWSTPGGTDKSLEAVVAAVVEECAKVAEGHEAQHELNQRLATQIGQNIAKAIRSLSATKAEEKV